MDTGKSRNWLGTLNNPEGIDPETFLSDWYVKHKAVYVNGQVEVGEEGTRHIQYYLNFKEPCRLSALKKVCGRSHFRLVSRDNGASDYCLKEETRVDGPWEFGVKPVRRNNKTDWEEVKQLAIRGDLTKIPADIFVKHYSGLTKIAKDYQVRGEDCSSTRGVWIWGNTGLGKSRMARDKFAPDGIFYRKLRNKWFDGYQGEPVIIMDDMSPKYEMLGDFLKDWTDHYGIGGETKGGMV